MALEQRSRVHWLAISYAMLGACVVCGTYGDAAQTVDGGTARELLQAGSKRGLASWTNTAAAELTALGSLSWWYDWALAQGADVAAVATSHGVEFIPMLERPSAMGSMVNIQPGSKALLTFKSPNFRNGSDVLPEIAAQLWPGLKATVGQYVKMGLPSAQPCPGEDNSLFCNTRSAFRWLDRLFWQCNSLQLSCNFDFIATAFYTCNADYLAAYLDQMYRIYGHPIWVLEVACPLGASGLTGEEAVARQIRFARSALSVLDEMDGVERYAWFGIQTSKWAALGSSPSLFAEDGTTLTELGKLYSGVDASAIAADSPIRTALTEALPPLYQAGPRAYSNLCDNCTFGFSEMLNQLGSNWAAYEDFVRHCRNCGYRDDWTPNPLL